MDLNLVTQQSFSVNRVIGRITAMAMQDEDFKDRLVGNPADVLIEHGLDMPANVRVEIMSSFDEIPAIREPDTVYLVISDANDLGYEDLGIAKHAAASCQSTASTACTSPSCVSSASTASTNSCS